VLGSGPDEARLAISAILPHVSVALPTFEDEAALYGDADAHATVDRLHAAGVGEVAVKQGVQPVLLSGPDGREEVAVPRVERIVDTTAAGDSFNGAYLAARLIGLPPREAAIRGTVTAGRVIGFPGAIVPREGCGRRSAASGREITPR
jgi:2-dehydro-3-deoxygluconokinase